MVTHSNETLKTSHDFIPCPFCKYRNFCSLKNEKMKMRRRRREIVKRKRRKGERRTRRLTIKNRKENEGKKRKTDKKRRPRKRRRKRSRKKVVLVSKLNYPTTLPPKPQHTCTHFTQIVLVSTNPFRGELQRKSAVYLRPAELNSPRQIIIFFHLHLLT